jgi:hypothetical protein
MSAQLLMAALLKRELGERGIALSLTECREILAAVFEGSHRIEATLSSAVLALPPLLRASGK